MLISTFNAIFVISFLLFVLSLIVAFFEKRISQQNDVYANSNHKIFLMLVSTLCFFVSATGAATLEQINDSCVLCRTETNYVLAIFLAGMGILSLGICVMWFIQVFADSN